MEVVRATPLGATVTTGETRDVMVITRGAVGLEVREESGTGLSFSSRLTEKPLKTTPRNSPPSPRPMHRQPRAQPMNVSITANERVQCNTYVLNVIHYNK